MNVTKKAAIMQPLNNYFASVGVPVINYINSLRPQIGGSRGWGVSL
jgi:hypothetical protein